MARKLNGYALVATVIFYLLFAAVSRFISGSEEIETGFSGVIMGLFLFVVLIVIHELIHAVFFKIFNPTGKIKFGFKNGMAFASSPHSMYSKRQFTWIALAPFLSITVMMIGLYSAGWFSRELFTLLTAVHAGACAGDFYYVYLFRQYPDDIKIEDTPVGINILRDEQQR